MRGTMAWLVLLGGCTFGRLDGLTGGSAVDAADAGVVDAGVDADAVPPDASTATDGGDAGAVLLSDSFADADTCNDTSFNSTLATSPNGRGDGRACKVCGQSPSSNSFSYNIEVPGSVATVGARYHASAWYRNPAVGATAPNVSFVLRSLQRTPFTEIESAPTFGVPGADWKRIETDLVLTKPAETIDVFLSAPYGSGVCFVFDDLQVTRTN